MADGPQTESAHLERSISLVGAVALVVGAVVGAGIYVMIAEMAELAGPAIGLAFLIAVLISLVGVLPLVQLAGALPRAGAGYLFTSRLLSPYLGVLTSYWIVLGGAASSVVVSVTLAVYVQPLLPFNASIQACALLVMAVFYIMYQFGMRLAVSLQVLMAGQFVLALCMYAGWGFLHSGLEIGFRPPKGWGHPDIVMAILLCYMTCMGFQVVAELGEEIKHARRNIPLALLIGGAIVSALYIVVGTVFVSSISFAPGVYKALKAPLSDSAAQFMSGGWLYFLNLGAFTAGWTSLNAAAIALPRELFAQARDGMLPPWLGAISPRTHVPQHAVTAYVLLTIVLILLPADKDFYGFVAGIGILVMSSLICLAALRLPKRFPDRYAAAYIDFPKPLLWFCAAVTCLVTMAFSAVVALERPSVLLTYAIMTVAATAVYVVRTRRFGEVEWAKTRSIPGEDEREDATIK